jgi:hypothetical protein
MAIGWNSRCTLFYAVACCHFQAIFCAKNCTWAGRNSAVCAFGALMRETEIEKAIREYREEQHHAARMSRPSKTCTNCREPFTPKFPNAKLCYACFRKRDRALEEYDDLHDKIARLEAKLAHVSLSSIHDKAIEVPDNDTLRYMIQKIHPDRSGGGELAEKGIQFLSQFKRNWRD